jgi:hypothetical protein
MSSTALGILSDDSSFMHWTKIQTDLFFPHEMINLMVDNRLPFASLVDGKPQSIKRCREKKSLSSG